MERIAQISRIRMQMSDLRAFSPEWDRLNRELIRLMSSTR